jgi:hypothetical protein
MLEVAVAHGQHTTRRALFVGGAAAIIAGSVAGTAAASTHPDAELIALGREFEAKWARERELYKPEVIAHSLAAEQASDEAYFATAAAVERIEKLPAHTMEGLRIKARAVSWCHGGEYVSMGGSKYPTTDIRLDQDIIEDILRMTTS